MFKLNDFIFKLLITGLAYFAPVQGIVHAVIALFVIDWITGVWKSCLVNKRRFTSYRLRKSVNKAVGYILAIVSGHILNESILGGSMNLPQIIAGYIGITELISILENLSDITGKDFLKEISIKLIDSWRNKYMTK